MRAPIANTWRYLKAFFRSVARHYRQADVWILAAGLSYYIFLALFPLLLVAVAVLGYVMTSAGAEQAVRGALERALPGAARGIEQAVSNVVAHRDTAIGLGLLGLLYAASGGFTALLYALRAVWQLPPARRAWLAYLKAVGGVLGAVLLMLLSIGITSLAQALGRYQAFGASLADYPWLLAWMGLAAPLLTDVIFFSLVYISVPNPGLGWKGILLGAGFAALAWELAKIGFSWYVTNVAAFDRVYGSLGGVVILLLWIYYSAVITLVGAILAQARDQVSRDQTTGQNSGRQHAAPAE